MYEFLTSPTPATCLVRLMLFDLVTLMILRQEYKLWSSSLCSLLQPHLRRL